VPRRWFARAFVGEVEQAGEGGVHDAQVEVGAKQLVVCLAELVGHGLDGRERVAAPQAQ